MAPTRNGEEIQRRRVAPILCRTAHKGPSHGRELGKLWRTRLCKDKSLLLRLLLRLADISQTLQLGFRLGFKLSPPVVLAARVT